MTLRALLRETFATARAARVPSLLTVVVVAAMCFAALATVGRSAAAAADVAARMEQAGARRLSVVDTREGGSVNERTLAVIQRLDRVERANALGAPFDVVNGRVGRGGAKVPLWPVLGNVDDVADIVWGRTPHPGEALVALKQLPSLGMSAPVGFVSSADGFLQFPIVGAYLPKAPFEDLGNGALAKAPAGTAGRELRVVVDNVDATQPTVEAVLSILSPGDPEGVRISSPTALAATARDLNTQMDNYGRSLLAMILGVGGFFVAAVVLADVLIHRRDLGRRRTLGITRSDLTLLVVGRTVLTALIGALLGAGAGWVGNARAGQTTPITFTVAVGVLAVLAAALAAVLPALYATRLDPVAVMRTP